jgi:hypothetical protein
MRALVGAVDLRGTADVQHYASRIGLVADVGRVDLEGHRESQELGRDQCLARAARLAKRHGRDVEGADHRPGLAGGEQGAVLGQRALDDQAGPLRVGRPVVSQGAGGLQQELLVALESRQIAERLHGALGGREVRKPLLREQPPCLGDRRLAHPAGEHGLSPAAPGSLDDRGRRRGGAGHGLGRQQREHPVYVAVSQAGGDGLAVALRRGVPEDVHRIGVGPVSGQRLVEL